jgi:hypothetical protein
MVMSTSGEKMMAQMNKKRWSRMKETMPKVFMNMADYASLAGLGKTVIKKVGKRIATKIKNKPKNKKQRGKP